MLLRDEEDGRGDKEPAPPPPHFLFVALSPPLLVTHDYALSTDNQVLLVACNSMTISVNLHWAADVVHTVCVCVSSHCAFYIWLAYTHCLYLHSVWEDVPNIYTVNNNLRFSINTYSILCPSIDLKGKQLTVCHHLCFGPDMPASTLRRAASFNRPGRWEDENRVKRVDGGRRWQG